MEGLNSKNKNLYGGDPLETNIIELEKKFL